MFIIELDLFFFREREQKERLAAEKKAEMEKKKAEAAAKEALKRMPPTEMFRSRKDEFSAWDEKGIPTHDIKGAEISKGQVRYLGLPRKLRY